MTFDQLKAGAAALAGEAVKTTGTLVQKGKKQVDHMALETRLSKAQRQLGALVYSLHKNGEQNDALVERYVAVIAAVEKEIEELEGAPTAQQAAESVDAQITCCPQCGAEVDPHAIFCPGCGNKLQ